MREILFRGKALGTGEWLYGDVVFSGGAMIWVHNERGNWNYIVDPETIGQHTGLTDKNDKRIFEGDIVRYGAMRRRSSFSPSEAIKRNTTEIVEKANDTLAEYIRHLQEENKALDEKLASLRNEADAWNRRAGEDG